MAALAATTLATLHTVLDGGGAPAGAAAVWAALVEIPEVFCLFVPLATFAGGISVAQAFGRSSGLRSRLRTVATLAGVAAISFFVLSAFIAPWAAQGLAGLSPPAVYPSLASSHTIFEWAAEYRGLVGERAAGQPVLDFAMAVAGVHYYLPFIGAVLAALLTLLGFRAGMLTSELSPTIARVHHWAAGFLVVAAVAATGSLALTLAVEHDVYPALASSLILVPPAVLVVTLAWSASIARLRNGARSTTPA